MGPIEAIYQGGVFNPLGAVALHENQRVRLNVESVEGNDVRSWLDDVQRLQQPIVAARGHFPDSTPDIAMDRSRDE